MSEAGRALKNMGIWLLIIVLCDLLRVAESYWNPLPRPLIGLLYLPMLMLFLIYYFATRITERSRLKNCLLAVAGLLFALACLREIKYNTFDFQWQGRYLWYLYYVPVLLIPLFSFGAALMINAKEETKLPKIWRILSFCGIALVLFVMTNDLHQQVFRFAPGFADWNEDYGYGWGFYAFVVWRYGLYLAALVVMVRRCRLTTSKGLFWIPILPMAVGGAMLGADMLGYQFTLLGVRLRGFPEIVCFTVAFFWGACIQIGLIPINADYGKLLKKLSLPVWIVSDEGQTVYQSEPAGDYDISEIIAGAVAGRRQGGPEIRKEDILLDEDTILHLQELQGGCGIWTEDISRINEVQKKLQELQDQLEEESTLIRLENRRKEEQAGLDEQNALYDRVAAITRHHSKMISALARATESEEDEARRRRNAALICFYGAYIKRISNMVLLAGEPGAGELYLAVFESFRYLEKLGILCSLGRSLDTAVAGGQVIAAYRVFEMLLETNLYTLQGVYANFSETADRASGPEETAEEAGAVVLRLVLEGAEQAPDSELINYASGQGLSLSCEEEEDTLYIGIRMRKGGAL